MSCKAARLPFLGRDLRMPTVMLNRGRNAAINKRRLIQPREHSCRSCQLPSSPEVSPTLCEQCEALPCAASGGTAPRRRAVSGGARPLPPHTPAAQGRHSLGSCCWSGVGSAQPAAVSACSPATEDAAHQRGCQQSRARGQRGTHRDWYSGSECAPDTCSGNGCPTEPRPQRDSSHRLHCWTYKRRAGVCGERPHTRSWSLNQRASSCWCMCACSVVCSRVAAVVMMRR